MTSEWNQPKGYKLTSPIELTEITNDLGVGRVSDSISYIADDLFEMAHPDKQNEDNLEHADARRSFVDDIHEQGVSYGNWFYFDWNKTLVRYPESDDYYDLRTFRNRNLITNDEQRQLRQKKIAVFGLSVGSKVVDDMTQLGIGNEYMLFDFDRLSPTNLNRLRATMSEVGQLKTTIAGQKMSELDPYLTQQHHVTGYDELSDGILRVEQPDVIIEEVDSIEVKAKIRRIAAELGIPVVMAGDVGDRSTIDVERYDIDKTSPFNGKISTKDYEALLDGSMSEKDKEGILIKILGIRNLSPRLLDSAMLRDVELGGFPQLGTTATAGGALATVAIRDIFLERGSGSVSRVYNPRGVLKSKPATTFAQNVDIIKRFIDYRKGDK